MINNLGIRDIKAVLEERPSKRQADRLASLDIPPICRSGESEGGSVVIGNWLGLNPVKSVGARESST